MSSILSPGERTTPWNTTGDLARRIAKLEANPASGGGGAKKLLVCWGGNLPSVTGPGLVWRVPFDADGSSFTFDLATAFARIETPGVSPVTFRIESSPGGEVAFTPTTITSLVLSAGEYEEDDNLSGSVDSGDLVRLVYVAVGTTTKFQVELLASE